MILTIGCQKPKPKFTEPAFYFWKSNFKLSEIERKTLEINNIKKLYIKFFDVSWNPKKRKPQFVAPIKFTENPPNSCHVVPVVFITNQTFLNFPESEIDSLAKMVFEKISKFQSLKSKKFKLIATGQLLPSINILTF